MTVKELINHLKQIDPNARVFRRGHEGGYDDVNSISLDADMVLDVYDSPYFGSHERIHNLELDGEELEGKTIVKGIVI
jgi:hypothetical protein